MAFMLWEYMNGVMLVFVWGGSVGGFSKSSGTILPNFTSTNPPFTYYVVISPLSQKLVPSRFLNAFLLVFLFLGSGFQDKYILPSYTRANIKHF
jgi:hypothetical protein